MERQEKTRKSALQCIFREYASRIRPIANRYGIGTWWDGVMKANMRDECEPTEDEVQLLSRVIDDERISRVDVPRLLGKSYRKATDDDDFAHVRTLRHVGIYSKVSALLHAAMQGKNLNSIK